MKKVAIIGISGYSGLELLRLLHGHSEVTVVGVYGTSTVGEKLTALFPKLQGYAEYAGLTIKQFDAAEIMAAADLVFFATSGIAATHAADFIHAEFPVIDIWGLSLTRP